MPQKLYSIGVIRRSVGHSRQLTPCGAAGEGSCRFAFFALGKGMSNQLTNARIVQIRLEFDETGNVAQVIGDFNWV